MILTPHNSTHIAASGYDPDTRDLQIKFTTGAIYAYHDVPHHVAEKLHSSDSVGTAFMREIRDRFHHSVVQPAAAVPVRRAVPVQSARRAVPVPGKLHARLKTGR